MKEVSIGRKSGGELLMKLAVPLVAGGAFWALAIVAWRASGMIGALLNFGYLGTALGVGLGLYALLPKKRKPLGRRVSLLLVGGYLFFFIGVLMPENIQVEGVFLGLLSGVFQAAVMHYLVAKIVGPLLFGRLWCGWACWTVMVLDLLPFKRPAGRLPGRWGWLRYAHLGASAAFVLILWFVFQIQPEVTGSTALVWFLAGNAFYYATGIALAYALKDNRAFCKYLCPVAVPLKLTGRFSLLKISTDASKCNDCGACTALCPMDVEIPRYVHQGTRVLASECSLCQTCVTVCHRDALGVSFGLDAGGRDYLRVRPAAPGHFPVSLSRELPAGARRDGPGR